MQRLLAGLVVLPTIVAACADSQVATPGPRRTARPLGCAVQIVAGTPPPPFVDLASVRVRCLQTARQDCLDDLRRQACLAGGDTVYALAESVDQHITYMAAILASRNTLGSSAPGPGDSTGGAPACTPICSPGFDCQAGRCLPLCNPACAPSEICNNHRTCEPAAAAPSPPAVASPGHAPAGG